MVERAGAERLIRRYESQGTGFGGDYSGCDRTRFVAQVDVDGRYAGDLQADA